MPRLTLQERETVMNDFAGHYEELLVQHPAWEIETGFGLTQLRALYQDYRAKQASIVTLESTTLRNQRAQRDTLFGATADDVNGVWFVLSLYKKMTRSRLPNNSPLRKTIPQIGLVYPGTYDAILGGFIEHWKLVNEALPPTKPLLIAGKSLANIEAIRTQIGGLATTVDEAFQTRLSVMRAEREQLFGDVIEDEREATSVIGRLDSYSIEVQSQFPGSTLAQTLPRIFPEEGELPRFPFNFRTSGVDVVIWWAMVESLKNRAAVLFLKEGIFEQTQPVPTALPYKVTFAGAEAQDELDEVELRDDNGITIAHGRHDASLIEPA